MKTLPVLLPTLFLLCSVGVASARDVGPDESAKLQSAGSIQPLDQLDAVALARHPGGTITDTELDEEYGKHIYQVDITDKQGVEWDVELDAASGIVLKDHQDR